MARCDVADTQVGRNHMWMTFVILALYGVASSRCSGPNELSGAEQLRSLGLGLVNPDEADQKDVQHAQALKISKYTRCELADALREHDVPEELVGTWVCVAQRLTQIDLTTVTHERYGDFHGLLLVPESWCKSEAGCGGSCDAMREKNGFKEWESFSFCEGAAGASYVRDCGTARNRTLPVTV